MSEQKSNLETIQVLVDRAGLQRLSPQDLQDLEPAYRLVQDMLPRVRPQGGYEAEPAACFVVSPDGLL